MAMRFFFRILSQGPPNPEIMQEKVQKGDFLKKPRGNWKTFFVLGSNESLEGPEH